MIESLLIANRGEIACRIIDTARELGIRTVAVYSDADAQARHVRMADEAVHIGPSAARESYLVGEKIIAAAKQTGAQAIHPGYGFLSENADFAQAVADAGLIWIGATPSSIRAMGLKDAAKKLMQDAGVPTTPGYLGENQDPDHLKAQADEIGYPVLIKAVAGGGGKGMRRVDASGDFRDALESCKREAASSFGDDRVLIEKYILSPRHIEVQIFGDTHGNVVHLFERDCSLQRRHQKVIEEAPAPGMSPETREELCAAAVRAAKAVDYVGAGTIEFIADASEGLRADRIWFMEMNTRLQVEHPVTEEITGVDLVEWQIRIAAGEPIPAKQEQLKIHGHAIEARLYAEDPATGFLPSTGKLAALHLFEGPRTSFRVETGVEQGDAVSPFYDPMIAKLIVHAENRADAIDDLQHMINKSHAWPVKTNAGFLWRCLDSDAFRSGDVTTGFIADAGETLIPAPEAPDEFWHAAALHVMERADTLEVETTPWTSFSGFRLNAAPRREVALAGPGETRIVPITGGGDYDDAWLIEASRIPGEEAFLLFDGGQPYRFAPARHEGGAGGAAADGAILAPMPGKVIAVDVAAGDNVAAGQKLVTLEAMKMEHSLTAPFDGTVAELNVETGSQVSEGTVLVLVDKAEE
ncbi:acetyl/propionyl/methylcrotonyl-CoA carboxylase subunit alpha [Stakelama tenebrarum]|uniref:Acetyl/propionyl/methylcrotonyl-CoA carboxylase subunit alpha n=1 Tax=Stakelama tenebrarum TaxID=2711215 RepID=A0A6G6Y706_9SPHN|nr:acetyl/propionyl/methylcrotonyl-CoA carboxylase subunit alpha [Sphingosinithalassobacter tenebrarum]QIG80705.1 acetyl/propionyl/methylcrotonyl-CoA carboxylase subunit alpha [Sphingosinithalassobacter tenebrarum]